MTRRLVGVGVGPGDPELVTVKGVRTLRAADVVFVPVLDSGETGRAEATVAHYVDAARVQRVPFDLDRPAAAWALAAGRIAAWFGDRPAATAAFATIGDPNVYSTFTALARAVRQALPDVRIDTVPGVTAMQDLAARSGTVLVHGPQSLALFPMTAGGQRLRQALATFDTVVAYKFGRLLPETIEQLRAAGRLGDAVYGSDLGLSTEDIRPAAELPAGPAPYLSTLIIPARREQPAGGG